MIRIALADPIDLGGEFVRWEVATAIAGAVLGIDPFDQPNVEEAKQMTRDVLARAERGEAADARAVPRCTARRTRPWPTRLAAHLARRAPNAYLALQAFIAPTPARDEAMARIRALLRDADPQRHDRRLRPALPPLDRPAPQGRRADRLVPPADGRPSGRPRHPGLAVHVRPAHRRPGGRRLRGPRRPTTCPSCGSTSAPTPTPAWPPWSARSMPRSPPAGGLTHMRIGFIGLGRMGANMVRRLVRDGHEIVVYNRTPEKSKEIAEGEGATATYSIAELVDKLEKPRAVWVMVPAGDATEAQIEELLEHLEPGDTIIDGGNTNFHDDVRRHAALKDKGIHYVDAGTSGGIWGLRVGYCLMVGGDREAVDAARARSSRRSPRRAATCTSAARAPATT